MPWQRANIKTSTRRRAWSGFKVISCEKAPGPYLIRVCKKGEPSLSYWTDTRTLSLTNYNQIKGLFFCKR